MAEQTVLERVAPEDRGPARPADPIASWLAAHGGARVESEALIAALCEKLVAAGLPLSRVSFGVPTLHPQLCGYRFVWRRGEMAGSTTRPERGMERSADYLQSPMRVLDQGAAAVRRRLDVASPQLDFPMLRELAAEGATDYVAMALHFTSGRTGYISWATDRPAGFATADLARLDELLPLIALRLELEASYRMSEGLLETYLGRDAARRVLAGKVRRGEGKRIRAAILLSDLRDFTAMSDRLPAEAVIARLDAYFDVMVTQVHAHGGEVLKFIGDGMLAVFDIDGSSRGKACCQAVHAAIGALRALAEVNRDHPEPLQVGIALHLAHVVYGNIGAPERLDFTVIGKAVNEAARMEALCRSLDRQILTSASFARSCTCKPLVSLGRHRLRGLAKPREIFTLAPE